MIYFISFLLLISLILNFYYACGNDYLMGIVDFYAGQFKFQMSKQYPKQVEESEYEYLERLVHTSAKESSGRTFTIKK